MLTYQTFTALYPQYREQSPDQLGAAVWDAMYADRYDREEFVRQFSEGGAPLQAADLKALEPRYANVDDDTLFNATMEAVGYDPSGEGMEIARAMFRGEADEREWGEVVPDLARGFASGANRMVAGAAWLMGRVLPEGLGEETADRVSNTLLDYAGRYDEGKSSALQQEQALQQLAMQERVVEGDNVISRMGQAATDYLTNPALMGDMVAGSIPYMVPGAAGARVGAAAGAGLASARGLSGQAAGLLSRKGAAAGAATIGGVLEGSEAATSALETVRAMGPEELANTNYPEYIERGFSDTIAREMAAQDAAKIAFAVSAPTSIAAGMLTARFEAGVFTGQPTLNNLTGIAIREPLEEMIQESSNQLGVNLGTGQPAFEGVPEAAGMGAAGGLAQAAAFKGVDYAGNVLSGKQPLIREVNDIVARGRRGEALTEQDIQRAQQLYPELESSFFDRSREMQDEADLLAGDGTVEDVESDGAYTQIDLIDGLDVVPDVSPQLDIFGDMTIEAPETGEVTPELDVNTNQLDLFDPLQGDLLTDMRETRSPRRGGLDRPNAEATAALEAAAQRAPTDNIIPTRPNALTNAEVYDRLAREQEAGTPLSLAEEQFVTDFEGGRVLQRMPFSNAEGEQVPLGVEPELQRGLIARLMPDRQIKIGLTPETLTPTEQPVEGSGLILPPGVEVGPPQPREFRTKREATLAAAQRDGDYDVFKVDDRRWRFRPRPPEPPALPTTSGPQESFDLQPPTVPQPGQLDLLAEPEDTRPVPRPAIERAWDQPGQADLDRAYDQLSDDAKALLGGWIGGGNLAGTTLSAMRDAAARLWQGDQSAGTDQDAQLLAELYEAGRGTVPNRGTIRLYRGLRAGDGATPPPIIESYTTDPRVARNFAGGDGTVVQVDAPVEAVIFNYGEAEAEVLVRSDLLPAEGTRPVPRPAIERVMELRQLRQQGEQLRSRYAQDVADWWREASPGTRLAAMRDYGLSDTLDSLPDDARAQALAQSDINRVPEDVLSVERLGERLASDEGFRQQVGVPTQQEIARYGGYSRRELAQVKVEVPVVIEETGETRTVRQSAQQALDESSAQQEKYRALLDCLGNLGE